MRAPALASALHSIPVPASVHRSTPPALLRADETRRPPQDPASVCILLRPARSWPACARTHSGIAPPSCDRLQEENHGHTCPKGKCPTAIAPEGGRAPGSRGGYLDFLFVFHALPTAN